jgi:hypothetical protein
MDHSWYCTIINEKTDKLYILTKQQPFNTSLINKYKTYINKLTDIITKQK